MNIEKKRQKAYAEQSEWTGTHHHHYPDQEHVTTCVIHHNHPAFNNRGPGFHDHQEPYYQPCMDLDCPHHFGVLRG